MATFPFADGCAQGFLPVVGDELKICCGVRLGTLGPRPFVSSSATVKCSTDRMPLFDSLPRTQSPPLSFNSNIYRNDVVLPADANRSLSAEL